MSSKVMYGNTEINYSVDFKDRKLLTIEIRPDLSIKILAPQSTTINDIEKVLIKRGSWITKQLAYFNQFLPRTPERKYVSGETHLYLGRKYILKVVKSKQEYVKLEAGKLFVYTKSNNRVESLLSYWYKKHAERKFEEIYIDAIKDFSKYNIDTGELVFKRMKNRWGSCTPGGKIILNPELIKAPKQCIRYVVVHELCHLVIPHHNKKFYSLLESILPDWKILKEKLELKMT